MKIVMKKIAILLPVLIASVSVFSQVTVVKQDTIVKVNGDEILGKVTEVTPGYIIFQKNDSAQIINQVIPLEDLFMIKYSNGTREIITLTKTEKNLSSVEMYAKGQNDADLLYVGNRPMVGTIISTFIYPPVGLIEGIISASTAPKPKNFVVPEMNLLNNQDYISGYKKQAHKKKRKKVFIGFGIGIAPWLIGAAITNWNDY